MAYIQASGGAGNKPIVFEKLTAFGSTYNANSSGNVYVDVTKYTKFEFDSFIKTGTPNDCGMRLYDDNDTQIYGTGTSNITTKTTVDISNVNHLRIWIFVRNGANATQGVTASNVVIS